MCDKIITVTCAKSVRATRSQPGLDIKDYCMIYNFIKARYNPCLRDELSCRVQRSKNVGVGRLDSAHCISSVGHSPYFSGTVSSK